MRPISILSSLAALAGVAAFFQSPTFVEHNKALKEAQGLTMVISEQKVGGTAEEHKITLGKPGSFRWENSKRLVVSDGKTIWTLDKAANSYTEASVSPDTLKKLGSEKTLLPWAAFFNAEWEKAYPTVKTGKARNLRGVAVTEVQISGANNEPAITLLLDSKTKVARGAILPGTDGETILFATKFELGNAAPASDLFAFAAPSGAKKVDIAAAAAVHYKDVQAIFNASCTGCHGANSKGGLRLDSYDATMKGGKSGQVVKAGDPDTSLILMHMRGQKAQMPPMGKLPAAKIQVIADWVKAGAAND